MGRTGSRGEVWRTPTLLLMLAAFLFWRLWLVPDGLIYPVSARWSDLTTTHWPNAFFIRHTLVRHGQPPLWRPLILSGEPFAANPLAGLWYPPNLLHLVLSLNLAFNLLFWLHSAWAGWGGYRLARALGAGQSGAYLAAVALAFAPKAVAHLSAGHVGLFYAWAWLPWTLWAMRRLAARPGLTALANAAVCAALIVLADVRLGAYGLALAGAYGLWCARRGFRAGGRRLLYRMLAHATGAALLGGALVAVQVSPLLAVAPRLSRAALTSAESAALSLPPRYLLGLVVAPHGGNHEWMTYVGGVILVLAALGLLRWPDREKWFWVGVSLAAGVCALGSATPVYGLLLRLIPAFGWLRVPARSWFLCGFAAAILAAWGLTTLERRICVVLRADEVAGRPRRAWRVLGAALAGAFLAGLIGTLALRLPANVAWAALLWPATGLLILQGWPGKARRACWRWALVGLALADLWVCGLAQYRVRPPAEAFADGRAAAEWLRAQPGLWRVYSPSYSIPQHVGALLDLENSDGVDPFQLSAYSAFMGVATGVPSPGYSVTVPPFALASDGRDLAEEHRNAQPNLAWLGLLNVRYLAAAFPLAADGLTLRTEQDGVLIYENGAALPRAFVIARVATASEPEAARAWLAAHNPAEAAVVENGPALDGPLGLQEARLVERSPNRIVVEAQGPGLLVLSEVYDPDWRATRGGRTLEIVRVDGILRGVYLERGLQRVEFAYCPAGLVPGAILSALGWLVTAMLVMLGRRCSDGVRYDR